MGAFCEWEQTVEEEAIMVPVVSPPVVPVKRPVLNLNGK